MIGGGCVANPQRQLARYLNLNITHSKRSLTWQLHLSQSPSRSPRKSRSRVDDGQIIAVSVAVLSALMGNRTALVLLCSFFSGKGVEWGIYPNAPDYVNICLIGIDLCALRFIVRRNMGIADECIAALFLVAWLGYALDEEARYNFAWVCVVLQMLLTFPLRGIQKGLKEVSHGPLRPLENTREGA